MMPPNINQSALHPQLNAAVALFLGAYLLVVLYQGNLGPLTNQARQDFIGGANNTGFWRWALAVIVLIMVAQLPPIRPYQNALIGFVFVAMMIRTAENQPGAIGNLQSAISLLFGRGAVPNANITPKFSSDAASGQVTMRPSLASDASNPITYGAK